MTISSEKAKEILDNAPEGAEYYGVGDICCYYKNVNSKSYLWSNIRTNNWVLGDGIPNMDIRPLSELSARFEEQPDTSVEWKPQAGVECEFKLSHEGDSDWSVCKVLCFGNKAVFIKSHRAINGLKEFCLQKNDIEFRKPLTPAQIAAQIAAQKREAKAIRLHDIATKAYFDEKGMDIPVYTTWEFEEDAVRAMWFAVVDDKGASDECIVDGEWWMCEWVYSNLVLVSIDGEWYSDDKMNTEHFPRDEVKPLYKVVKG